MLFFSAAFAPLVFMKLPGEAAGRFIRQVYPVYYSAGAAVALVAVLVSYWSLPCLVMALVGFAFLVARFWLMPEINRHRDLGLAGDAAAMVGSSGCMVPVWHSMPCRCWAFSRLLRSSPGAGASLTAC